MTERGGVDSFDRGRPAGRRSDVAIVGMACRYPGAPDLETFWRNVLEGRDATRDVPPDRWDPAVFFDPAASGNDRVYCRRGGYLDAPVTFDPALHGVMPLAVEGGEPEQFLVLDAARAALDDAGYAAGVPEGQRTEVVIGRGNYFNRGNLTRLQHGRIVAQTLAILRALHPDWTDADLEAARADLKASLPPFEAGTVAGQLTNATAGRVADRLNLTGASYVVDAASASSLVALDLAARALVEGRADLALVGGVYVAVDVDFYQVFGLLGALSRGGTGRPFGAQADGMIPGEGVGVVVLKRLHDAEWAGDRIYAVLKGVGLASDGQAAGLAAPSARGHARAMRRAYRRAGVDPATVGLVEGHGLGVPAADRAELRALRAVFPKPEVGRRALGAVSSMIGHAMPAAGMAGLIKTALALHHRVLPPTLHAEQPHPLLTDDASPFELNGATRPWIHGDPATPRRAGVNAFGFAGVNAHAVLEEHAESADADLPGCMTRWDTEAILLGASDRAGVIAVARALLDWLGAASNARVDLKDLAATLNTGQVPFPARAGLVVTSVDDLRDRLGWLVGKLENPECRSIRDARGTYYWESPLAVAGKLAFLYAGEGAQYPGMLADLCPHFPELRKILDGSDRIAREGGHARRPSDQLFGGADASADRDGLWAIGTAVNVVLSTQWALQQVLDSLALRPDAVAGHSSGEILALTAAGVLDTIDLVGNRLGALGSVFEGLETAGLVPGARLVAVAADRAVVEAVCRESDAGPAVVVAIDNCPHQVVIAGPDADVDRALVALRARGLLCEVLPFARAYHTPAFAAALEPLRSFFESLPLRPPTTPVYSCSTAGVMAGDIAALRAMAVEQWVRPVEFRSTVEAMYADGVRLFVEVGARGNLAGYVEDILRGRPHFAVAANLPRRSGLTQLNHLVASLYAQGVALRPEALYVRRRPRPVDLSRDLPPPRPLMALALGFPEMRLSDELVARLAAQRPAAAIDGHAFPIVAAPPSTNGHTHAPVVRHPAPAPPAQALSMPVAAAAAGDETLLDYFRTMDQFLDTQRQVMEAYLAPRSGSASVANPAVPAQPAENFGQGLERGGWGSLANPGALAEALAEDRGSQANPSHPAQANPGHAEYETPGVADETASAPTDVCAVLLDQVSKRTGYPREMLDLAYDMEADLGIDSIKRVEILGELQALSLVPEGLDLERLSRCRTLGEVAKLLEPKVAAAAPNTTASAPAAWPGTVEKFVAGREFVGTWPLDAATDPVAWHHTLGGRRVSALEPGRLGLPVVPFTIMAEMLAQAAATLVPGRTVVALRELLASRWVAYEANPSDLELRAACDPARPGEVRVSLRPRSAQGARRGEVAFEGVVVFAESTPHPPAAEPLVLDSERVSRLTARQLYDEQWLFHGPLLQALTRVGRSCPAGTEGTLTILPHRELLPERLWPVLHTDPIVLDAFTHLLGGWGIDRQAGQEGSVMFPLRVTEIAQFGAQPAGGTNVDCRIRVREITRHKVRIDAELVRPDETVWVRIKGWEDWRFYWPDRFRDVMRAPDTLYAGEPVALEGQDGRALAVWLEPPVDFAKPIWRDVLEWTQFGPSERAANRARGETEPGLTLRIWGRVAAKEAARRLREAQGAAPVYPADLTIESDPNGRPALRALAGPGGDDWPAISIAHTEGVAVALAALDPTARVGVDVERVRPLGEEFEMSALLDPERIWLDEHTTSPAERDEWVARIWCCKEAAAKSTGLGMIAGPASALVVSAEKATGRAIVTLGDDLAARCPEPGHAPFVCRTERRGDHVWAWTNCERERTQ